MSSRFGPTVVRYKCKGRRTGTRDRRFLPVPMDISRQPPCSPLSFPSRLDVPARPSRGLQTDFCCSPAESFATRTRKAGRSSLRAIRRRGTYFEKAFFTGDRQFFYPRALCAFRSFLFSLFSFLHFAPPSLSLSPSALPPCCPVKLENT